MQLIVINRCPALVISIETFIPFISIYLQLHIFNGDVGI